MDKHPKDCRKCKALDRLLRLIPRSARALVVVNHTDDGRPGLATLADWRATGRAQGWHLGYPL